jgi:hypothetical protein
MQEKTKRIRIPIKKTISVQLQDPLSFISNKASDKARLIKESSEQIKIELWYDKHYCDRNQHGDDNGKREGIDHSVVENLVLDAIKHLLFYSSVVPGFAFINSGKNERASRIVCQREMDEVMLNVVIEVHYKSLCEYEVTVKTAMRVDDFIMSDGQYAVELFGIDNSVLKLKARKKVEEILEI